MYLETRKPVSHSNEIDLLQHFPLGSLIGGELLPHAENPAGAREQKGSAKPVSHNRVVKYHW